MLELWGRNVQVRGLRVEMSELRANKRLQRSLELLENYPSVLITLCFEHLLQSPKIVFLSQPSAQHSLNTEKCCKEDYLTYSKLLYSCYV